MLAPEQDWKATPSEDVAAAKNQSLPVDSQAVAYSPSHRVGDQVVHPSEGQSAFRQGSRPR